MADYYDFVAIPKTTIGAGIVDHLKRITLGLGTRYLIVFDHHVSEGLLARLERSIAAPVSVEEPLGDNLLGPAFGLMDDLSHDDFDEMAVSCQTMPLPSVACTREGAEEVSKQIRATGADVIVAVGGSKCLDLVRAALHFLGTYVRPKLVLVPTIVASNACSNGISIMYDDEGRMTDFWNLADPPERVLVDAELVAAAPARLIAAGIGDQVSSSLEALHTLQRLGISDQIDPLCAAHHKDVLEVLKRNAVPAYEAVERSEVTRELEWVLNTICCYTGPELTVATSFLSHILDEALISIPEVAKRMHGEIVGFGVFPEMVLMGTVDEMWPWVDVFEQIGIPCTLEELGIPDISREEILAACRGAQDKIMASRSIVPISPEEMTDAVIEADRQVGQYLRS